MSKFKCWPAGATVLSEKAVYGMVVLFPLLLYIYLQLSALGFVKNRYEQSVRNASPCWHITGAFLSVLAVRQIIRLVLNKGKIKSKTVQGVITLTLAVLGLQAYSGFHWYLKGGERLWPVMLSAVFLFIGSACKAIADTLYQQFESSVFKWKDPRYWNPHISWRYVNRIRFTRFRPDAWHLANSGMIISFLLAAIFHKPQLYWIWELLIGGVYTSVVFNLFYTGILQKKNTGSAQ